MKLQKKEFIKKIISFCFILSLLCTMCILCSCNANSTPNENDGSSESQNRSDEADEVVVVEEGECGESITWKMTSDGSLTISGTGEMEDYDMEIFSATHKEAPWSSHKGDVKKVVIEKGITKIGNYSFFAYSNLTEISLPVGLLSIGDSALFGTSLPDIKIPFTVTTIGDTALSIDTLTTVEIPANLRSLGTNAIRSEKMVAYTVAQNNNYFSAKDGVLYDYLGQTVFAYPNAKTESVYVMPDEVTTVVKNAFFECDNLLSIVVSTNLKTIEDGAFRCCGNITSFTIPDSVESLGHGAFDGCTNLASIHIGAKVNYLTGNYFGSCKLSAITVSSENPYYTAVGGKLFSKDMSVLVYYPCNLPGTSYEVPFGVKEIGPGCFYGAKNLTSVIISNTVEKIGYTAFEWSEIQSVYIPTSVIDIGFSAFSGCDQFTIVNYAGTASDWINITIGEWNSILLQAKRNYNALP